MDFLEVSLLVAALLVGATGTWSPCGFSMIETIGPTGHTGGRWVTPAACATFLPGAVVGAVVTFGALSLIGSALPGGWLPYAVAAVIAVTAAVAEARGSRIAPQIRRQLPEHWRRVMPMPVAAALYGVLLGLGFTTFVLTFGVWALAGIALALGEPLIGLAIGVGFGVGRALPIIALAPIADRPAGRAAVELLAERPGLYRGIRLGDAVALAAAAAALSLAAGAEADVKRVQGGADPSVEGDGIVNQRGASRIGELRRGTEAPVPLPGTDPALSTDHIAVLSGPDVVILDRGSLAEIDRVTVPGADAIAISEEWLVVRARQNRTDRYEAYPLAVGTIGDPTALTTAEFPSQLSRPSLAGKRLAYGVSSTTRSKIVMQQMPNGNISRIVGSPTHALTNPAINGQSLLYVRSSSRSDELRLRKIGKQRDRRLRSSRKARMWSTALSGDRAYVTLIKGRRARNSRIVSEKLGR